jgi:putative GTP pyrophosphokinase
LRKIISDLKNIKDSYEKIYKKSDRLRVFLVGELKQLIDETDIALGVPIESRVKTWESVQEKIERKMLPKDNISGIEDIVGVRIILLFKKDVDHVVEIIKSNLVVISSEDTALRLSDTQFGYQSQHFIVEVPSKWLAVPTRIDLEGIRVEIQVRTVSQHIWAAISHKLQYKQEVSVPPPLRRSISRASALLEMVDIEFERFLEARNLYIEQKPEIENSHELINVDIIDAVLGKIFPPINKHAEEDFDELLNELYHFGVNTAKDLSSIMRKHYIEIMKSDMKHAKEHHVDHYFRHVGLAREGLRNEFGSQEVSDFILDAQRKKHEL